MNAIKKRMIAEARRKYRRIFPCSYRRNLDDCFTIENNEIIFWFNTEDFSTHTVSVKLP